MPTSTINDSEILIRFIFSPYHIHNNGTLRWQALKPNHGETSVTRKNKLSDTDLLAIGKKIESVRKNNTKLSGSAEIIAKIVRLNGLDVVSAPAKNNKNHANIVNWPKSVYKDQIMTICQELVNQAKYIKCDVQK